MEKSIFQFTNPQLEDVVFHSNANFDSDLFENIQIKSNTSIEIIDDNKANVHLQIEIGDESHVQPFFITIKMGAIFKWETGIEKEMLKKLLKVNAPALLLSYIRPIVANLTSSSSYPTLNLPYLDMSKNQINTDDISVL